MKIAIITRFGTPLARYVHGYYYRLYYLVNGLVERGHKVTVLAHPKTKTKAKLIKASVKNTEWETQLITYVEFLKKHGNDFDIINAQTDHMCCFLAPFIKTPIVHTMIFGGFWAQVEEILKIVKNQYFTTNSKATKNKYPFLNWQGVVYNGLDISQFKFNAKPRDYLLFLSRVVYEKGVEDAIKVAKQTRSKLIIAGRTNNEDYFNKAIKTQLGKDITYFGMADFKQKINLLKNAKVLLHPHLVHESCSNTILEAQACGTPVIAYPHGSTREVVRDKKTGFVVNNIREMVQAINQVSKINRSDCREFIENNFTIEKMVDGYERTFQKIIKLSKKNGKK
ncbi:MAG: glycosyltransferase family 4 protein [Patescibacteria group bacterium]